MKKTPLKANSSFRNVGYFYAWNLLSNFLIKHNVRTKVEEGSPFL